jgi:hypothetical protein
MKLAGAIITDATDTGVTVTTALAVFPSTVAVMVAVPAATAVTSPVADTVATVGDALLQPTARPVSTAPFTS